MISADKIRPLFPRARHGWVEEIASQAPGAGIDTPEEIASLLSQLNHESRGLTAFEESLDYSAARLAQVWRRFAAALVDESGAAIPPAQRVPNDLAYRYQHSPMALANFVYAGILGNGDEASGDGWIHRGMGPIQLTGRANHDACGAAIGRPLLYHPELLLTPEVGVAGALWFWRSRHLDLVDRDHDVLKETLAVSGSSMTAAERQAFFETAMVAMT